MRTLHARFKDKQYRNQTQLLSFSALGPNITAFFHLVQYDQTNIKAGSVQQTMDGCRKCTFTLESNKAESTANPPPPPAKTTSNIMDNVTLSWVGLITFSFKLCPNSVAYSWRMRMRGGGGGEDA